MAGVDDLYQLDTKKFPLWLEPDLVPGIAFTVATTVIKRLYYCIEGYALGVLFAIVRAYQSALFSFEENFFALRTSLHAVNSFFYKD